MNCDEVLKHLVEYLDRELDAGTSVEISRHLDGCRGCFSRAEFEKRLKARLRAAGSRAAPERLRERIKKLVDEF